MDIRLKSKELIIEKLKVLGQLILKLAIAYVIVVITKEGYIKRVSSRSYQSSKNEDTLLWAA